MALQFALNRLFVVTANLGTLFENVSSNKSVACQLPASYWGDAKITIDHQFVFVVKTKLQALCDLAYSPMSTRSVASTRFKRSRSGSAVPYGKQVWAAARPSHEHWISVACKYFHSGDHTTTSTTYVEWV